MANRICCYCGVGYTNKEGLHPYEDCVKRLNELIGPRQLYLNQLNKRLEDVKRLVNERSQRQ